MRRFPARMALFLALLPLPADAAAATDIIGRIFYEPLSKDSPSFFFRTAESVQDGKRVVITTYTDKEGKELTREENTFESGKLTRSVYKQSQVNEHGEVVLRDGKAQFSFTDESGTETDSEDIEPNMVLGAMIPEHILANWDALMKGDSVHVRYLAIERCETVGFKFFKDKDVTENGQPAVEIVMKPSSFIIAAVVDPIRFTVTKDEPRRVVRVVGRTPIRWPRKEPPTSRRDWKAIDARIEMDSLKDGPKEEAPKEDAIKTPKKPPQKIPPSKGS